MRAEPESPAPVNQISKGVNKLKTFVTKEITRAPLVHASQRKGIIGGSQIGTIIGIDGCYSSELETYRSFIGIEENPDDSAKESFYAGNRLEEAISQWFSYDMGLKEPAKELDFQYVDPEEKRLVLHPDREFTVNGKRYALECKTASSFAMRGTKWPELEPIDRSKIPSWVPEKLEDGRELVIYDGSKSVMPGYYCQCLWYYALAGYDGVFLARLTDNRLYIYFVEADVPSETKMYNIVRGWLKRVDNGYVPAPKTVDEARMVYPSAYAGKVITASEKTAKLVEQLRKQQEVSEKNDKEIDRLKGLIAADMGDAEVLKVDGKVAVTFKGGVQTRFDSAALKKADADTYNKYVKTINTARIFRLAN
jgi:predicted phage-related endonuclease